MKILILILILFSPLTHAAQPGLTLERGSPTPTSQTDRTRLARTIYKHTFENIRDPETGSLLPQSAALNTDNWPDFWEPIRAVGFPEYLIPTIQIETDTTNTIPGAYRDLPNHVLTMSFDGTRVGIRTKNPVPVDPELAYEYSLLIKDTNLQGARIRTGIEWMRIDPASSTVLRADEMPNLAPGQQDWPVVPFAMLVNDPPPNANAARLFVIVDRDPNAIGGAYHGSLSVDNISLKPLPKITIDAPKASSTGRNARVIPVHYHGLYDNIPDPDNPGFFKGRRYSRRVEITDVFGVPINLRSAAQASVEAGDDGISVEEIPFPSGKYGIYYFNIRLYDAENSLLTDVMRSVAVMRPERKRDGLSLNSSKPVFGVNAAIIPPEILSRPGFLRTILDRSGIKMTKIRPWRDTYSTTVSNDDYYNELVAEIRHLRTAGFGVTGVISPPSAMFEDGTLQSAAELYPDRLNDIITEAGRHLGLFVDSWQWGRDDDPSFASIPQGPTLDTLVSTLREFAGGLPTASSVVLAQPTPTFNSRPAIIQAQLPEMQPATRLWPLAAPVFPWLFEPYFNQRGTIYPPAELSSLAPLPPVDKLEEEARKANRSGAWISLEPSPIRHQEPNAAAERVQLEETMVKAIYAAILSPDAIYLGSLFDPGEGMIRRDATGGGTLETMIRPTFLAARTLSEYLEGSDYLGRLWLLPPFEAHVFRRPGTDDGIIAIWHNDTRGERSLSRAEIANGPPLEIVDWAGNRTRAGASIPVRRVPSFITGISANLLLTRMSMRIEPQPAIEAQNRRQSQSLEIVNHMNRQAPVLVRLKYAARMPDGAMENSWMLQPQEMRLNLPPASTPLVSGRVRYDVTPDANSQIQEARPGWADKAGLKIAQARVTFNTSPPADMTVFLPYRLLSDIDVDIEPLYRMNDPNFLTVQLKLRWFPSAVNRRRSDIKLRPYYMKRGQMKEAAAFPVAVKALPLTERGNPDAPFEAVELRIPRNPRTRTWVGLDEVGGSRFYLADVTGFLDTE